MAEWKALAASIIHAEQIHDKLKKQVLFLRERLYLTFPYFRLVCENVSLFCPSSQIGVFSNLLDIVIGLFWHVKDVLAVLEITFQAIVIWHTECFRDRWNIFPQVDSKPAVGKGLRLIRNRLLEAHLPWRCKDLGLITENKIYFLRIQSDWHPTSLPGILSFLQTRTQRQKGNGQP